MLCLTYFTLGEDRCGGSVVKYNQPGARISSSSDRPVGLLYTKAQGGCCTCACVQWCEVRRRVVKRAYSVLGSG